MCCLILGDIAFGHVNVASKELNTLLQLHFCDCRNVERIGSHGPVLCICVAI